MARYTTEDIHSTIMWLEREAEEIRTCLFPLVHTNPDGHEEIRYVMIAQMLRDYAETEVAQDRER